jgi:hypothetical protein
MKKINFRNWFKKPSIKAPEYDKIQYVSSISDVPKKLDKTIFIVRSGDRYKWAVFKCPDNCGNRVEVNLMESKYPFWRLEIKRKKVTLEPSVIVESCHSHFCLINSKVVWAID